jgi:outer membrane lipoprotein-sorting protein
VKQRKTRRFQACLILLLLVLTSCIKKTIVVPQDQRPLPAKSATRGELFQKLLEHSEPVQTLKGTVTLDLTRGGAKPGVLDQYRQTRGYVFVERPSHIRIQVQLPIVLTTVAIMVSDGQQYRISIPIKNQFAIRDVNEPATSQSSLADLRPQMFLDGLFVDIKRHIDRKSVSNSFEEAVEGIHSYYVFSFFDTSKPDAEVLEKIWIDRTDLQVARKQVFGKEGRLETEADYQNYHTHEGIDFPDVVTIRRPVEALTVKMTFQQTSLNEKLDASVFNLPRPEGAELVQAGH